MNVKDFRFHINDESGVNSQLRVGRNLYSRYSNVLHATGLDLDGHLLQVGATAITVYIKRACAFQQLRSCVLKFYHINKFKHAPAYLQADFFMNRTKIQRYTERNNNPM